MELTVEKLTKRYGDKIVLHSLCASFSPGIYGIIGKNGAGKSTWMNLMADNLKRTQGQILLDGTDILELGAAYRGMVGYMPQTPCCYGSFSARGFLNYMAQLKGIRRKDVRQEVDQVLEVTHLTAHAGKKIQQLSGGMRQRVMLAQALLGQPSILLLDEPTAGLDPAQRASMRAYIHSISPGKIIFIATHVISDIETIADEIVLLKEGRLLCKMPPKQLILSAEKDAGNPDGPPLPESASMSLEEACLHFLGDNPGEQEG